MSAESLRFSIFVKPDEYEYVFQLHVFPIKLSKYESQGVVVGAVVVVVIVVVVVVVVVVIVVVFSVVVVVLDVVVEVVSVE